ncbi:MAG TPA: SCO family protein [Conexibacter sp.]|nr:SCO family protein [Conexibacter sp.]
MTPSRKRAWWIRRANLPERRRLRAAVAAVLLTFACSSLAACGSASSERDAAAVGAHRFAVAESLPPGLADRAAPHIRLADARGGIFDTRSLAGKPYLVTFLYTNCPDVCPLIGAQLRDTLDRLGADAGRVGVVAVSVDPRGDTPASVRAWLLREREPTQFHYLIGSQQQLRPVWSAWYAAPQIPGDPESAHTAIVWLVDARGRLAAKVAAGQPFDPSGLARDVRSLLTSS